ncbi:hypothetical protein AB4Y77_01970 [Paenarthrobacter sp. YAF11_1]|uniref:hypothetical protein n=1 Tax=Paenarthrobacter sp. YAF11_1 TaxID=3233074 RepID=UPI003F99290C
MTEQITLAELIRQHQEKTGDSYSQIAIRSGLSKAKIGQLGSKNGQLHMPRIDTIEKLASGLRLPLHIVQQAAMASAGVLPESYSENQEIDLIVAQLRELSPDQLATAARLIQALRHG